MQVNAHVHVHAGVDVQATVSLSSGKWCEADAAHVGSVREECRHGKSSGSDVT